MKVFITLLAISLIPNTVFSQTDEEYDLFSKKLEKTYKLTEEQASKFTDTLKEARKEFQDYVKKLEEIIKNEKLLNKARKGLPSLNERTAKMLLKDLSDEDRKKVVELAKEVKEKIDGRLNKLTSSIPEEKIKKIGQYSDQLFTECIIAKKLPRPRKFSGKTTDEKISDLISEMGIDDKEKSAKISEILKKLFEAKNSLKKAESELKRISLKKDISDDDTAKAKELLKQIKEKNKEIDANEEALLDIVNSKQFTSYLKHITKFPSGFDWSNLSDFLPKGR